MVAIVLPLDCVRVHQGGQEKNVTKVNHLLSADNFIASTKKLLLVSGICSRGCLHGNCIAPDDCQCHSGWTGERCDMGMSS